MSMPSKPCKDCAAELHPDLQGTEIGRKKASRRPIAIGKDGKPVPGPRCATHHREERRRTRTVAHNRRVAKVYGLDAEGVMYAALYEAQGGRCFICQRATGATKKLSVDHDHACCDGPVSCGKCVRGLLCSPCNRGVIGHLRDDPEALLRAVEYLRRPPAQAVLIGLN